MRNFREYDIWKLGMEITKSVYLLSKNLPSREQYGIISQIHRAAVSIPSNIAEGSARKSEKEFSQFLHIAMGSAFEVETQLLLIQELNLINDLSMINILINQLHILQKQINHLISLLN
ncbi:MAG: four helix bundle protein [Bacteroidales bacterium]|nr:four helix bundle protein [Bacteroidales bacterium]